MNKAKDPWFDLLIDFTTDYIEGNLDGDEKEAFEAYLDRYPDEKEQVKKAIAGRKALRTLSRQKVRAAEDFEAKLALAIAMDGQKETVT